ncbi:multidrug transporter MdtC [Klebsiella pneumoniae]|uniref:Multidrug transporter MdtC n=1 Tax=Klebsiella pneumoniae TaxID=573 RepID=A0A2X3EYG9_KLEPN|nr:multidrug transporter MdtC [Klebsiella pneumoniae]
MMCGWLLKSGKPHQPTRNRGFGRLLVAVQGGYGKSLKWVLKHSRLTGLVVLGTIALSVWLYISIPKTFFPEQDTGVLMGGIQADQSISFQAMRGKLQDFMKIIREDPAVDNVTGFTGGSRVNSGMMFITLQAARPAPRDGAAGDRPAAQKAGQRARGQPVPDGGAGYPRRRPAVERQLSVHPAVRRPVGAARVGAEDPQSAGGAAELADVNSDQQDNGAEMDLVYDRDTMSRLGISVQDANNLLNNAFGQRQISTIYQPLNQYKVVMEVDPAYTPGRQRPG